MYDEDAQDRKGVLNILPWRDNEDDALGDALDIATEARLVCVCEGDVRQGALCDGEHVLCAVEEAADFAGHLRHGPVHTVQ